MQPGNPAAGGMEAASMGMKPSKPRRAVLRLRDLDHSKSAVLNSLGSPASRRAYEFAIDDRFAPAAVATG